MPILEMYSRPQLRASLKRLEVNGDVELVKGFYGLNTRRITAWQDRSHLTNQPKHEIMVLRQGVTQHMAKTPTVHNPKNFEPSDYEVVDYLDNNRPLFFGQDIPSYEQEVKWWETEMLNTFGADWRKKIHHCVHCGNARVRWITATKHIPSGDVVVFGAICTARLGFADKFAFKLAQLQAKAEAGHAKMKIWNARVKFLAANPAIAEAIEQVKNEIHAKNFFVKDVLSKLNLYGSLSERQVAAVLSSLKRDVDTAASKAVEAAEVKGNAPEGRLTVTGTVLGIKGRSRTSGWSGRCWSSWRTTARFG